ncbi:MAG: hypothetical protein IPJ19_20445 [Planctomycetes bacterium]|nr:hypothetical protein [Planctomycetota bacterium]
MHFDPAASDWSYRAVPGGALEREFVDDSVRIASAPGRSWALRESEGRLRVESRLDGVPGARAAVALPRGEALLAVRVLAPEILVLATGRALYVYDDRDPLRLAARVPLPAAAREACAGSGALLLSGDRLTCAAGSALAVFRVR